MLRKYRQGIPSLLLPGGTIALKGFDDLHHKFHVGVAGGKLATLCSYQCGLLTCLPARCAARYAQKAYLTRDMVNALFGVCRCLTLATQKVFLRWLQSLQIALPGIGTRWHPAMFFTHNTLVTGSLVNNLQTANRCRTRVTCDLYFLHSSCNIAAHYIAVHRGSGITCCTAHVNKQKQRSSFISL